MAFYKNQDEFDKKKKERARCRKDPKRKPTQCKGCTWMHMCSNESTHDWLRSGSPETPEK